MRTVLLLLLLASSPAHANDAPPPITLTGVDVAHDHDIGGVWSHVRWKIVDAAKQLGGRTVIVWEQTDTLRESPNRKDTGTWLGIADVATKERLFFEPLVHDFLERRGMAGDDVGHFAYTAVWKDLDGDGEDEAIFTRQRGDAVFPAAKVFQVRWGELQSISRKAAMCPHDGEKLAAPADKDLRGRRFRAELAVAAKALDGGEERVRCAMWSVAETDVSNLDLPDTARLFVTPTSPRTVYWLQRDSIVGWSAADGRDAPSVELTPDWSAYDAKLEARGEIPPGWEAGTTHIVQLDGTVQNGRLYLIVEATIEVSDPARLVDPNIDPKTAVVRRSRDAFIVDVAAKKLIANEALVHVGTGAPARTAKIEHDTDGTPRLAIKSKHGTVTWSWDAAGKQWVRK